MNLYELSNAYQNVLDMQEDMDEEIFLDTLSSIEEPLNEKVENIARFIKNLEAEAEMFKKESQKLSEKATMRTNKAKRLKEYLQDSMETVGKDKVKGELFTVAIQNNPPSVRLADDFKEQEYFIEVAPKIDRKAILADLKRGKEIAGAELQQTRSVRIR